MANFAELSKNRYTTKAYDANKKIPDEVFKQLCTVLRNSPSSVNSQPWHFFVVSTDAAKEKIMPGINEFNHSRVRNSSHTIVFCARTKFNEEHLNNLLLQEEKDGRFPTEQNKKEQDIGRRRFLERNNSTPEELLTWESKQVYLAMGSLLYAAASMGINSTPIEGFDVSVMDKALGLKEKGLTSVVVVSLGYSSKEDFNAHLPKSRLPEDQIFTFL